MCIYRLNGIAAKNSPKHIEYAHHTGMKNSLSPNIQCHRWLTGTVRKLPPLRSAVKLSARSLYGKIIQRLYRATRSASDGFVVWRIPNTMDLNLLNMAIPTPVRT